MKLSTLKAIEKIVEKEYQSKMDSYNSYNHQLKAKYGEWHAKASKSERDELERLRESRNELKMILEDFKNHQWK